MMNTHFPHIVNSDHFSAIKECFNYIDESENIIDTQRINALDGTEQQKSQAINLNNAGVEAQDTVEDIVEGATLYGLPAEPALA